jgi:thiamine biosynthesis protein ThiC
MADNLDDELYPHNDDTIIARPTIFRANASTGLDETVPLTGRADGVAFLSTVEDIHTATAIAGLSVSLTEIGATAVYQGVMEGSAKATALAATPDNTTLYRHIQFGSDYRRVIAVLFRKSRRGAAGA